VLSVEPTLELAVEPEPAKAAEPIANPVMAEERVSLRNLPELSLQPSAPVTMPRPTPLTVPSVARPAATPEPAEPRVSFKDLAAALRGASSAPATPTPAAVETVIPAAMIEPVAAPVEVVVEPVSPALAAAVAELEPALTVEALINSTLSEAPAAPVAP